RRPGRPVADQRHRSGRHRHRTQAAGGEDPMKALVFQDGLAIRDVPEPVPTPSQALVEIRSVSVNFGEAAFMSRNLAAGTVPGWDAAGVVRAAAADGSGPPAGTRVAG